ncbi:hypothetical protein LCGC14_0603700 [marine sediment metagenome]|uniref:Uncharacterized protein n=1 Tax=marine sediment metagenome TaxID=412755 RepID=A0A0F9UIA8_9ZZZZ
MRVPLIIYIDQNHWDKLEKVYYSKLKNDLIQDVLNKLNLLKSSNKIKIILDLQRAIETAQRTYDDSRIDLSNLMFTLSDESFVIPWVYLQDIEIENFFLRKQGKSENFIREIAIGKGFSYMMGETPEVQSDSLNSDELTLINEKLKEYYPDLMKIQFERYKNKDEQVQLEQVHRAEEARKILFQMDSDDERKQLLIEKNFIFLMRDIMNFLKLTDEKKATISDIEYATNALLASKTIPHNLKDNRKRVRFMKEFPIIYTHSTLVSFRDRDLRRKIDPNDLIDIASYAVPIAYLDVVLGEKYFITLAKQAKLDELYGCRLFSKMETFFDFLNQI